MNQIVKTILVAWVTVSTINGIKAGWDGKTIPLTNVDGITIPTLDKTPPINQSWFGAYDLSTVPVIAQTSTTSGTANPVYTSSDILECGGLQDWGLSYDDGPSQYTDGLLGNLTAANLSATFFVVGSRVVERPDLLLKEYQLGHQIACHTWSHPYLTSSSNDEIVAEMEWCSKLVSYVIGLKPRYMRPPYGDIDARVRGVLQAMGYQIIIWEVDSTDWMSEPVTDGQLSNPAYDPSWITGNITSFIDQRKAQQPAPTAGPISLEHDLWYETAGQAPAVFKIITSDNFTPRPIGACRGDSQWYTGMTTTAAAMMSATMTVPPATLAVQNTMVAKVVATQNAAPSAVVTNSVPTKATQVGSSADTRGTNDASIISPVFSTAFLLVVSAIVASLD